MYQKGKSYMVSIWFYLFLGGFILGVLLMNLGDDIFLSEDGIFSTSEILRLKYLEVKGADFFPYVLKKRIQAMLIPALLSTTVIGCLAVYGCLIWQGMLSGMFITAAVIRFGSRGLLLVFAGGFPHQFLLFPAMIMLFLWCYDNCTGKNLYMRRGKRYYMRQAISLVWISFMVLVGCILESYVNPMLLSDVLKIF